MDAEYNSSTNVTISFADEVERWNREKNIVQVKENTGNYIVLQFNMNSSPKSFKILYPSVKNDPYIVEYVDTRNTRLPWIDDVNMYCINKSPTPSKLLTVLYKQIDKTKDQEIKEIKITKLNGYVETNTDFGFDMEKYKKGKEIDSYISISKSQITTGVNNNSPKEKSMFHQAVVGKIVATEFMELWEGSRTGGTKNKYNIDLVDKNIFHWRIKYTDFEDAQLKAALKMLESKYGYNYIEVDIHIHDSLYPNYPPTVKVMRPRLMNSLMHRISNTKMIQLDYWTPSRSMSYVITKLYQLLNKHAKICVDIELNDTSKHSGGAFLKIETFLLDLASLVDTGDQPDIDDEKYESFKIKSKEEAKKQTNPKHDIHGSGQKPKQGVVWSSGTGYGTGESGTWDAKAYMKSVEERDNRVKNVLNKIITEVQDVNDNNSSVIYNAIQNSILISYIKSQLRGTTLLEISKHKSLFDMIFMLIGNLANENAIHLFDKDTNTTSVSLFSIMTELNNMCKTAIKYDKSEDPIIGTIMNLYSMIEPCYEAYRLVQEKNEEKKQIEEKKQLSEGEAYVKKMCELRDKDTDYKLIGTNYQYQNDFNASKDHKYPSSVYKRLRDELISLGSLPIDSSAIIIARPDKDYITAIRTLITGPEKTPYECGIFIFDTFINTNFPTKPPNVWYLNHGGVRFNPNLYDNGKVCLSILGTWRSGEDWNPITSTLLQIYVSIQSQILVENPYFNEPGHERYNNEAGMKTSEAYDQDIRLYTMKHAMLGLIRNPEAYPQFSDVIRAHFSLKKQKVLSVCENWVNTATKQKNDYITTYNAIKTEIEKL
ncbi:MAG: ubiquitin-conjugating enzyme E2 [Terrestrivirus sp.]|uniref:E2 ubiquitin-conjugating enzyme n=1 Tax=Terrestrivirus sp. TaxID=2487775 RepID=A0A3G4ZNC9_9VIRU|nr:MAG: ubiquitin-conjugating enzyme E2 [Terrestrivirus sp.]